MQLDFNHAAAKEVRPALKLFKSDGVRRGIRYRHIQSRFALFHRIGCRRPLDDATRRKVEKAREESGGDPLIRAQDFNKRSLPTITVTPVDGEWFAAAYLDTYNKRCVVVPVRATMRKGQLVITDIALP